ncbi:Rho-GAP domain-containing protein [Caenorhabditis elegans]|uniref:Rho-GAP domain-containing protein n=1 Tax=Caenorhabditis elegans TaxID=6239 RepID=H2KZS7_CAEEL|nr:Rho-GAP domain-containing protein [Caenorhabditis elegans]CCD69561.1 Rho-GAP domain-containing protein [Caenorhabditis elegans]|eukprot:NP_001041202.1 Rho GTPase Activating protein [Caenorhabditis elegans]
MEHNDFRVVTSSSVYRKGSTTTAGAAAAGPKSNKLSYTLGEVCSTNVTLDVNVGTGWTRIRLKEVPKFIVHAFNIISKHGMDTDGIFRKEGNSVRLNRAEVQAIYKGQSDIPNDYSVIDVCTMVKRFLRDLKPPLLDSEECRARLLKKACQARISDSFLMTRDEMADIFYLEDRTIEQQTPLLSDVHASTLGYVMRQLYREIEHSQRVETSMSGRLSAMSQSSLRSSNDTHQSSSDRFSDVSDLRNAAFSESTSDSALSTPTATPTTSRVSTNDAAAAAAAAQHF